MILDFLAPACQALRCFPG